MSGKISGDATVAYKGSLYIPAVDTGASPGSQNVKLAATSLAPASVATIAALRLLVTPFPAAVFVAGYAAANDGGGGQFLYASGDSTTADNGGSVIVGATGARFYSSERLSGRFNVRRWGAKGDGSTNDATAIQAALTAATAGYRVEIPGGTWIIGAPLTMSGNGVILAGASEINTILQYSVANGHGIVVGGMRNEVRNLFVKNPNISTSACAGILLQDAVEAKVYDCLVNGFYSGLVVQGNGADSVFFNVKAYNFYGAALCYISALSHYLYRCKFDPPWWHSVPTAAKMKGARGNLTPYDAGDVVILAGYYVQCMTAGTSGGSAPALQPYENNIVDGSCHWWLCCKQDAAGLNIDTAAAWTMLHGCDIAGAFNVGVNITNTGAGVAPQNTIIRDTNIGEHVEFGLFCCAASVNLTLQGSTIGVGIAADSIGVYLQGDNAMVATNAINTCGVGVEIDGGACNVVTGNQITGCTVAGVIVDAGTTGFSITDNWLGSSPTFGANALSLQVSIGASDNYIITGNNGTGALAGQVDGGTGVNKVVANNI